MNKTLAAALFLTVASLSALPANAADPAASPAAGKETIYPAPAIAGKWMSMGMPPVMIAANRAAGPASRLLVHLPKNLQKSSTADFALSHTTDNTWVGKDDKVTVSFSLTSENFGVLKIIGDTPDHRLEMPLSRF